MARIRTVKPMLFRHEELFEAEVETGLPLRLAFIGLFTCCDREGRFHWRPRALQLDVMPYDNVDFSRVLDALATRGFVVKYEVDGEVFGCIPSFSKHQIINNRELASDIPAPCSDSIIDASSTREGRVTENSKGNMEGEYGREGKGKVLPDESGINLPKVSEPREEKPYPEDFEQFWKAYPTDKNMPKKPAFKQWQRLSPDKRAAAIAAIPGFRAYCRANDWYRPIYADRFLSQEKFEGYAIAAIPGRVSAFNSPEEQEAQRAMMEKHYGQA